MRPVGKLSTFIFDRRRPKMRANMNQIIFPFITFFLCVSSGLGALSSFDCKPQHFGLCSSACDYVRNACDGDSQCFRNLCTYLNRQELSQLPFLYRCKDLVLECAEPFVIDETKSESKRGIFNKNLAYLLLKLNPFFNQTSQFGFLTSGRIRRITGNFGTEFLGKRSDKVRGGSRSRGDGNQSKVRPTTSPRFYSLPLNKFSQVKVLKRDYEYPDDVKNSREKRTSIRGGHGGVILGSEFLGKRGSRDFDIVPPGGSDGRLKQWEEGKRDGELPMGDDLIRGSELLGKKSSRYYLGEFLNKKLVRNRLRKQTGNELLGKKSQWPNDMFERTWSGDELRVAGENSGQDLNLKDLSLCKQSKLAFEFCRLLEPDREPKSN